MEDSQICDPYDLDDGFLSVDAPDDDWLSLMKDSSEIVANSQSDDVAAPAPEASPLPEASPTAPEAFTAARAVSPLPEASPPHMPVIEMEHRYQLWVNPIKHVLGPIHQARGQQLSPAKAYSGCSGLCTEHKPQTLLGVDVVHEWTCDPDPASFNFITTNGPEVKHHFCDLYGVSRGSCFCFQHERICEVELPVPDEGGHKLLTCGTSCRPFSTARVDRMVKNTEHADRDLWSAFLDLMIKLDVDEAWLENVMGILLRESRSNPRSPLEVMVEEVTKKAPQYSIRVFFQKGTSFLFLSRRRVFVHFCHARRGGADTQRRMTNYISVEH